MNLADSPAAVAAGIEAERESVTKYTLMDIRQGPGEGNYDRVQELRVKDILRAAEAAAETEKNLRCLIAEDLDEADTLVMQEVGEDEGEA